MNTIEPLYDKKCTCPFCQSIFTTKKMRSRFIKVTGYDTDFSPHYQEHNPLLYYINVCPHCGFSFPNESSTIFSDESRQLLTEKVSKHWIPHSFDQERTIEDSIKTHKLAAYCSHLQKSKHIVIAGLYIRIAWHYRLLEDSQQEKRFLTLALSEYELAYSTGDYQGTQITEMKSMYLIGELSRRTGNTQQAIHYFSKIIEQQSRTTERQIVTLAKEGWQQIKDQKEHIDAK